MEAIQDITDQERVTMEIRGFSIEVKKVHVFEGIVNYLQDELIENGKFSNGHYKTSYDGVTASGKKMSTTIEYSPNKNQIIITGLELEE
jgi:hypothetical protein